MITIRKNQSRGLTEFSWLKSFHTFSFGDYVDPQHMGFGDLRVINEDTVAGGEGFGMHPHRDMEIITYVTLGTLEHKDSMGTHAFITPGEVQRMSAGTGITHSEMNASKMDPVHLLQIWILPAQKRLSPSYEQKDFSHIRKPGNLTLLVSPDGSAESLRIHQDASLYVLDLKSNQSFSYRIEEGRMAWVQVVEGSLFLNEHLLAQGDGAAVGGEKELNFKSQEGAEVLIFDLVYSKMPLGSSGKT
jgi:redox-sensitive bicupin YhaK (pirin superfamily)